MGIATRDSLRDWLRAPGSLSRRLAKLGARFEVQLLRQGVAPFRALERLALGLASDESPTTLRERVTSKGGTTHAAITSMQADAVDAAIRRAVLAAQKRAAELGKEFG